MIIVLLVYMLFASTFTFGKMALNYSEPIFFIGTRMLTAGSLLLGYQYFFNRKQWSFRLHNGWLYIQIILFHIYIAFVLEFWALKYVASSKACLIYNLSPFITACYSFLLFGERLNKRQWLGLGIGFCGLLPSLLSITAVEKRVGTLFHISWPEFALLGAVASAAYGWMVMKKLLHKQYSFVMVNGIGMLGGGALAMITSLLVEGQPKLKMPETLDVIDRLFVSLLGEYASIALFIFFMLLLILIANVICYNLYGYLLHTYSATFLSFAGFTTPLFAAFFDWIFIGDMITLPFLMSVLLTFWGLYIFYQQESRGNKTV